MKTAISIPNDVFEQAEALAKKNKVSRSELYTKAIKSYLEEFRADDVTAKLDEIYEGMESRLDKGLLKIQLESLSEGEW